MTALVTLLVAIAVLLVSALVMLGKVSREVRANTAETRELRLTSRARVRDAVVRTGADTTGKHVRELHRFGRQTQGKRVVVGGDEESGLHQALSRQVRTDDDSNE